MHGLSNERNDFTLHFSAHWHGPNFQSRAPKYNIPRTYPNRSLILNLSSGVSFPVPEPLIARGDFFSTGTSSVFFIASCSSSLLSIHVLQSHSPSSQCVIDRSRVPRLISSHLLHPHHPIADTVTDIAIPGDQQNRSHSDKTKQPALSSSRQKRNTRAGSLPRAAYIACHPRNRPWRRPRRRAWQACQTLPARLPRQAPMAVAVIRMLLRLNQRGIIGGLWVGFFRGLRS